MKEFILIAIFTFIFSESFGQKWFEPNPVDKNSWDKMMHEIEIDDNTFVLGSWYKNDQDLIMALAPKKHIKRKGNNAEAVLELFDSSRSLINARFIIKINCKDFEYQTLKTVEAVFDNKDNIVDSKVQTFKVAWKYASGDTMFSRLIEKSCKYLGE